MADVGQAPHAQPEKEPFYMRMTPMELDVQLQTAELIFRNMLEGKLNPMSAHEDIQSWEKDVLGQEWANANDVQRKEILRQVKKNGENTPAWMECMGHMGDIAWEVFEAGQNGEAMRSYDSIDRTEIIEQFKDLKCKVQMSYYGKCGACDRLFGIRACIALFRICKRDSEVLELMVSVLIECIKDNEYHRDVLTCLTVPAPPLQRGSSCKDRGWSFLRNALNAFIVQAGGAGYGAQDDELATSRDDAPQTCSKDVAVLIAECLVHCRKAPAVLAQLKLVHEDPPADHPHKDANWVERRELRQIIPIAMRTCQELNQEKPSEYLETLSAMLDEGAQFFSSKTRAAGASEE